MADKRQNQFQNQFSKDKNRKDSAVDALKVPPHSFEAEQSVLGGLFIDNEAWDRVTEFIVAKDFYSRPHQLIFEAMAKLVDQHIPLDIITVSEWLDNEELLDDAGGFFEAEVLSKDKEILQVIGVDKFSGRMMLLN